ncbi:DNA translocase FtsK [Telmatocola sphagniphila]|uniref:DNA translocase FtsK n=2 Tax=Telmatocola sphagniphila TaxID=1123043 RepID=A0A8E6EXK9_9BACT|nr:DNA translocase FtsK [Telmatocola sphagniphila]
MIRWVSRALGWFSLVFISTVILHRIDTFSTQPSSKGAGGSVGSYLVTMLAEQFGQIGFWVVTSGAIFGALSLGWPELLRWLGRRLQDSLDALAWSLVQFSRAISPRMRSKLIALNPSTPVVAGAKKKAGSAEEIQILPLRPRATVPINPKNKEPKKASVPVKSATQDIVPFSPPMPKNQPPVVEYSLPPLSLLEDAVTPTQVDKPEQLQSTAQLLEQTFAEFGVKVSVIGIHTGPVITQFEIALDTGLRLSKVTALADDLALKLEVRSIRIVPMQGKNTVGVEVPNKHRAIVRIKELVTSAEEKIAKCKLPLFLGRDNEGGPLIYDLAEMPHLLVAGRTGTGKSVCLNSIILSLLLTRRPDECKMIMIDPKKVELAEYGRLPHLMHPVVTDSKKSETILSWAVDKMEERYELLRRARVRNISTYNELSYEEIVSRVQPISEEDYAKIPTFMPYIVIVVDEVGDLLMEMKKEVEGHIIRLAQKSRASGIHLILTTQRPTVDVITGLIKSNLPARICFQVASRMDSRVVLDEMGAEKLLGKGDMLFLQPNTSSIVRAQGAYASDPEINRIVAELEVENPVYDAELLNLKNRSEEGDSEGASAPDTANIKQRDKLFDSAVEIVVREGRGSVSLLQRALGIGYGRAARLIDMMAEAGIVGEYNGAQAREVLFTAEQWAMQNQSDSESDLAESA